MLLQVEFSLMGRLGNILKFVLIIQVFSQIIVEVVPVYFEIKRRLYALDYPL